MDWPWGEIFLARHGETEWNVDGRRQGQLDSPLTRRGWDHANQIAAGAHGLGVDALFASPLGRALQTAEVVADRLDIEAVTILELKELDHGAYAGMTNDEIEAANPGELGRRDADKFEWRFPEGESYADAIQRARVALLQVADGGALRPLVVSHNMISRMLIGVLLGCDPNVALGHDLHHGEILRVRPGTTIEAVR